MDTSQWPEGHGVVKSMEQKKKPQVVTCPRCNSTQTKFCYYNNYSLSQPRYYCKTCRRYWTAGGSLRNVPVGGGSRRNKRSNSSSLTSLPSSSSSSALAASISKNNNNTMMAQQVPNLIPQNPSTQAQNNGSQGLTLAYPIPTSSHGFVDSPYPVNVNHQEIFKHGIYNRSKGEMMSSFISSILVNNSQRLNVSLDGLGNNGGYQLHNHQESVTGTITTSANANAGANVDADVDVDVDADADGGAGAGARLFFPFEGLKPISASTSEAAEPSRGDQGDANSSATYWNAGLGGGPW